jgi:hypothetical protein
MAAYLLAGSHQPLRAEDRLTMAQIAETLAGAGLQAVCVDAQGVANRNVWPPRGGIPKPQAESLTTVDRQSNAQL